MFATPAYAQAAGAAAPSGLAELINFFGPMLLVLVIFWFLVFRPQQQKAAAHRARLDAVKKNDNVVTGGGILGKVTKVDGETVEVEIATGVRVKVYKATLTDIVTTGAAKPAND
ncbi:MAG: preprotein translocase subunit YajC [Sphingomonadaceae bacterium]